MNSGQHMYIINEIDEILPIIFGSQDAPGLTVGKSDVNQGASHLQDAMHLLNYATTEWKEGGLWRTGKTGHFTSTKVRRISRMQCT